MGAKGDKRRLAELSTTSSHNVQTASIHCWHRQGESKLQAACRGRSPGPATKACRAGQAIYSKAEREEKERAGRAEKNAREEAKGKGHVPRRHRSVEARLAPLTTPVSHAHTSHH